MVSSYPPYTPSLPSTNKKDNGSKLI
jgi:hypothetical protein